jgi:phage host-nuclease inhibitor protein Gam
LASAVNTGFKRTEDSLADLYQEVVKLSARLGRPGDPNTSHGSAYGDLDALKFYVAEVDSKCGEAIHSVLVHDKKFVLVDDNFRRCSEALNQAVSASTAAFATASDAKNTVSALNATGALGQVASLLSTISVLEKKVATQQAEIAGVNQLLEQICGLLNSQSSTKSSTTLEAQVKSLEAEIKSLRSYTAEQLKIIRQSVDGHGPVKVGSYTFDGVKSCADVLNKMNITVDVIEYLMDPFHILAAILYQARTREDVNTSAILSMKANQSPGRLTAMASFETIQPEIFSGCRTARTDVTSTANFCSIKTHDLWDSGDGETGVKNFIEHMLIDFVPQFAAQVEQVFGDTNPEFCELAIMIC